MEIKQLRSKYFLSPENHFKRSKKLFPCGFALLSAGFLCMDREQRSLYCNKEAAATYTCCSLSNKLKQVSKWFSRRAYFVHIFLPPSIIPHSCNKFNSVSLFCFLDTLHLIALFWIPTVHWQLRKTTNTTVIKLLHEGKKLFANYLWTNTCHFVFFPSCVKGPFLRKLLTGSCFVLCVATSPRDKKNRQQYKLHLTSTKAQCQFILSIICWTLLSVMKMRAWASPQVLSSKRPASDKGKGDRSSRALSPRCLCFPMSLSLSLLLCAQVWALTHQLQQQLLTGNKFENRSGGASKGSRQLTCGWFALCASPCVVEKVWEGTSSFVLWSPPLSTRVIDGWGSFWPRLVHFALQRVPPSQSQTTMHTTVYRRTVDMWDH